MRTSGLATSIVANGGKRQKPRAAKGCHLAPRQLAGACDVVDARDPQASDVLESADHVVLLHELDERVESGDRRAKRPGEVGAYRRDDVGPEHVGEPQEADNRRGVVLGEVADELFDLDEGPLHPRRWAVPARTASSENHAGSVSLAP